MQKIGVGILTCNRQDFFKQCIDSIPNVDSLVVVNDGDGYSNYTNAPDEVIEHQDNKGVGVSKNEALKYLMDQNCDHLFLIEDDMLIKDANVFEKYIKTSEESGIWHLNFGYHGPANKLNGNPNPRMRIKYDNEQVALNPNCVGSFSYYHKGIINNVGYFDEFFNNAWEHVEHTYSVIKKGLHPPFWWFADVENSYDYISELACSEVNSAIRKTPQWHQNLTNGSEYFRHKHGYYPVRVPNQNANSIGPILKDIKRKYSRKVL